MSVADKLVYINQTKASIRFAIIGRGVAVPEQYTFRQLADKVAEINGVIPYDRNVAAPAGMPPKLAWLYETKLLIKNAIQAKGVTPGENFRDYAFKTAQIHGGGAITWYPTDGAYSDPMFDGMYPTPGGGVITWYATDGAYSDPMLDGMCPVRNK
jgi:hypothetical protein